MALSADTGEKMRVLVHGITGHMGRIVARMAEEGVCGATLAGGVSPDVAVEENNLFKSFASCNAGCDVVIDFSFHGAVKGLLDYCVEHRLPAVVATTGHTEEEKELIKQIEHIIGSKPAGHNFAVIPPSHGLNRTGG